MALVKFDTPVAPAAISLTSLTILGANGSTMVLQSNSEVIADLSAVQTTVALVPLGAQLLFVTGRVITAMTTSGATNTMDIGDGVDPDRWGDDIAGALGTTWGQADFTVGPGGWNDAIQNVTFTPPGVETFATGSVRVVAYYWTVTPPTS